MSLEKRELRAMDEALVPVAAHFDSANARLLEAWRAAVVADRELDQHRELNGREFTNEVPRVLGAVADALRTASPSGSDGMWRHGAERFRQGYGFHETIRELTILRRVLCDELVAYRNGARALDQTVEDRAYAIVNRVIDEFTSETARAYGQARAALEGELHRANRRLREQDAIKERFIATVAHELRSPLNVISGVTQMLAMQRDRLGDNAKLADMLERNVDGLIKLINDLLDYSRLTGGREAVELERFDPVDVIAPVVDGFRVQTAGGAVDLEMEIEHPPAEVISDRVKVVQIVTNLLANAVKFTERGSIVVTVKGLEDATWQIEVRDTGPGIAEADLARVFDEFVRLNRRAVGTGLGLPIARRIAESLGGALDAASVPGDGSTFLLTLPVVSRDSSGDE